jgi:hypothetical protein
MDISVDHKVRQNKIGSERKRAHVFPHMWKPNLRYKYTHKDIYAIAKYITSVHKDI